ncbi:hypothetical protein SAMN05421855_103285 [Ulvibacter litoralis]|uniref:Uncharacterized protein n=1 Tax=Ulvibacter litoralis TaxID=227084 RepID=A0A1G7GR75_9FLAO|nr:hypothetical protein [Ulvibacter litoralis]SDE90543.1 hypothetical protein SAMN05421855_103285 [Ulvibacter litoralis]
MFSPNQLIFAIFFVVAFVIVMIFTYRKDKNLHKKYYKGSFWILIGFVVFIGLLLLIKSYVKQ